MDLAIVTRHSVLYKSRTNYVISITHDVWPTFYYGFKCTHLAIFGINVFPVCLRNRAAKKSIFEELSAGKIISKARQQNQPILSKMQNRLQKNIHFKIYTNMIFVTICMISVMYEIS